MSSLFNSYICWPLTQLTKIFVNKLSFLKSNHLSQNLHLPWLKNDKTVSHPVYAWKKGNALLHSWWSFIYGNDWSFCWYSLSNWEIISASSGPPNTQQFKADSSFLFITDVSPLIALINLLLCLCNWSRAIRENNVLVVGKEKSPFMKLQNISGQHWSKVASSNQNTVTHRE